MNYLTADGTIGHTPLIQVKHLPGIGDNTLLLKLEGNNPAGSIKDRPAYSMIHHAQERGEIKPGDRLIEPTSGNTGIALAMCAVLMGYRMTLIMPKNSTMERRAAMKAYGAEVILAPDMIAARDMAQQMQRDGAGRVLDQFNNPDNPRAHFETTGPEIWKVTQGTVTHFVSAMGTTGTIMGTARYLKQRSKAVQVVGVQPDGESKIPGIRCWPKEYLPGFFDPQLIDRTINVRAEAAEDTMRTVGQVEGVFCGPSSGGALWAALQLCREVHGATIVSIVCDRGDRYISTGVFPA
ncbi:MAG: cysteine synthase CysM [Nevskiaceae bacterium]|nr:MAG: cysteine synthase CysM [Nevskiaceae bacterium]TBR74038.1 MAG: cysteine synthase CysM [Nevskiaceae bacterium]